MRILMIATAATLLMLPATRQANACEDFKPLALVTTTEYSADMEKKPVKKARKAKHHVKKEKVEYMRAVPAK